MPHLPWPRGRAAPQPGAISVDPLPSDFGGETARCYARYRREYPYELIEYLRRLPRERTLFVDLGCGTGQLALRLAPYFERCVGIDPERDMLQEAERLAGERAISNAEWIEGSASNLPPVENVDLVTVGTAFHFMEPRATLQSLRALLREDGAVAVAYNGSPIWLHPEPWARALRGALEEWFGPVRDLDIAVEGIAAAERAMHELGYRDIERWERVYEDEVDAEFVVGHIFSALSPDQVEASRRSEFAHAITAALPLGTFSESVHVRAIVGRP